nr:hypothetical protein [uncultured Flavobacterium sp.]
MAFIPLQFEDNELLIRFIFTDHFKKKNVNDTKILEQEVFLYSERYGVSLQREHYTNEQFCKNIARNIPSKSYAGFVLFTKKDFLEVIQDFLKVRSNFDAKLEFSPLSEKDACHANRKTVCINCKENPSHCDIFYLNPGLESHESNPKIPLRIFSRELFKRSKLIIDKNPNDNEYCEPLFKSLI